MKRNEKAIAILSLVIAILIFTCVRFAEITKSQSTEINCIQDELEEVQNDRDYYFEQYKKYSELSTELENQMGVYNE